MLERLGALSPGQVRTLARIARPVADPVEIAGITLTNRVGLAAGVDKDAGALAAWPALGFGHVEIGTVTGSAQPGNPAPRLFRLPSSRAVINRMGFNNAGAQALAARLRETGPIGVPIGVSIGKTKAVAVEDAVEDYLSSVRALDGLADYLAVNVSSPNTPGLRGLQDRGPLRELLAAITSEAAHLARRADRRPVPVFVKIAPDLDEQGLADVVHVAHETDAGGLIATNTTMARDGIAARDRRLADEAGGLSGRPLTERAREVVSTLARQTDLPIIGVGGIMTASDAEAMLEAGAAAVQVYTGFIYAGPALIRQAALAAAGRGGDPAGAQR